MRNHQCQWAWLKVVCTCLVIVVKYIKFGSTVGKTMSFSMHCNIMVLFCNDYITLETTTECKDYTRNTQQNVRFTLETTTKCKDYTRNNNRM